MKEFLKALRPETLFGSLLGFAVAASLAFLDRGVPHPGPAVAALGGLICLHLSLNLIFQSVNPEPIRTGAGEEESRSSVLLRQWSLLGSSLALFMVALALGFWLVEHDRPLAFIWGFGGVTVALAYTFVPIRWRRRGLGQILIILGFGPLITLGAYYALTGRIVLAPALVGLPQAFLLAAITATDPERFRLREGGAAEGEDRSGAEPARKAPLVWTHLALAALGLGGLVLLYFGTRAGLLVLLGFAVAPLSLGAALDLGRAGSVPPGRARTRSFLAFAALSLLLSLGLLGERFLRI